MIIGVTGGVGAGKSTVLNLLKEEYDAKLIFCDDVARQLQHSGGAAYDAICAYFGDGILCAGKGSEINRAALAKIVFNDEEKLKALNSLTHPLVKEEVMHLINVYYSEDPYGLIVIEAALLIEAGYRNILDDLWCVCAPKEVRTERLMQSRGYTRSRALDMMENQKSDEQFISECDFALNNVDLEETRSQIKERVEFLKKKLL